MQTGGSIPQIELHQSLKFNPWSNENQDNSITMEKFFEKIYDEVADTFVRVSKVLDESFGDGGTTQNQQPEQDPLSNINIDDNEIFFEEHESPLKGMTDNVLSDIMKNQVNFFILNENVILFYDVFLIFNFQFFIFLGKARPESFREHVEAFTSAIDWKEPLILSLLGFQVLMFGSTIWVVRSKNTTLQLIFMLILTVFCRSAGRINTYGSEHWQDLGATQNYFDSQGVFVTAMVCFPLLLDSILLLICMLREAAGLFVTVARMKVKAQAKAKKESSNASSKKRLKPKRGKTD
jgi:hypothetical protein